MFHLGHELLQHLDEYCGVMHGSTQVREHIVVEAHELAGEPSHFHVPVVLRHGKGVVHCLLDGGSGNEPEWNFLSELHRHLAVEPEAELVEISWEHGQGAFEVGVLR